MKGFIFSVEMIAALSLVALVIGIIFLSTQTPVKTEYLTDRGSAQMMFYFNESEHESSPFAEFQRCEKVIYYNQNTFEFEEKQFCWWYN